MDENIRYQVVIKGVPYGTPQASRFLAEQLLANLPTDTKMLAEISPVLADGKFILLD